MEVPKTKVGIFGIGAIGSVIGCSLMKNVNLQLYFFNRSKIEQVQVWNDDVLHEFQINCESIDSEVTVLDYLIICIKEHHYQYALAHLKKLFGKNTMVYVLRNGLFLKESLTSLVSESNVRECIVDCSVQPKSAGGYIQYSKPKLTVGAPEFAKELSSLFCQEVDIVLERNFHSALWKKVCLSSSIGGILCLVNDTCVVFQNPEMLNKLRSLLIESITIANKDGAKIEEDFVEESIKKVLGYHPSKGSSMLTDLRLARKVELGAKNGIIQSMARKYELASPLNDEICSFVMKLNRQKLY